MAYTKQNFVDDKTLYASQLNHIEDGIVTLETDVAKRVSVNAQTLTAAQKKQARTNIGVDEPGTAASKVSEHNTSGSAHADIRSDIVAVAASSDIVCPVDGEVIVVADASDRELKGMKLYGKTIQNGTPTPEAPVPLETVGTDGNVAVTVVGKNLFNSGLVTDRTMVGITTARQNDGGIKITGTATMANRYIRSETAVFLTLSAGTYTLFPPNMRLRSTDKTYYQGTFTLTKKTDFNEAIIVVEIGTTYNEVLYIQLESGATATAYAPYNTQTLTAQTPNGLPGIPVSSGGNYIDGNGQMWVCDEIDFARGKYVQRVGNRTVDNARKTTYAKTSGGASYIEIYHPVNAYSGNTTGGLSNAYPWASTGINNGQFRTYKDTILVCDNRFTDLDTGVALLTEMGFVALYALTTPIETDLTAEENAQYSALHTNYPNTTIYNDEGAGMEVKYVADTKMYIDNKFTELAAALVNN